jgi:hypothetical protein
VTAAFRVQATALMLFMAGIAAVIVLMRSGGVDGTGCAGRLTRGSAQV